MAQVVDRGLVLNARGDYVETLVDSLAAGGLRTDDTAILWVPDEFQRQRLCPGEIGGVLVVIDDHRSAGLAGFLHALFGPAGDAGRDVKGADDRRPKRTEVWPGGLRPQHVVGGNASLAVGRAAHRQGGSATEDEFLRLDGIAGGVNVRVRRLLKLIDRDVAARTERQTGVARELRVGADAHRQHDEIRFEDYP